MAMDETIRQARIAVGRVGPGKLLVRYAARSRSAQPGDPPAVHRTRALILIALALALGVAVSACGGGGDDGGEDPQQVLKETFATIPQITSGSLDLDLRVESEGDQGGTGEAKLSGPFQTQEGKFPQFKFEGEIQLDSGSGDFSGSGGLTSTGQAAFLNVQGTDYEAPQELFDRLVTTYTQIRQTVQVLGSSEALVNASTDLSNEGDEDVDGADTTHISGTLDLQKFADAVLSQAEQTKGVDPSRINRLRAGLESVPSTIGSADFDVFSGKDDHLLRKLELSLTATAPAASTDGAQSSDLELSLTLSALGEPQTISAPADPQPLANLLRQFGIDPSQLGGSLPQGGLGGGALPQSGGSQATPSGGASQAYLQCLQQAQGEAAVTKCAQLLQ
jgi:hypothetical protein